MKLRIAPIIALAALTVGALASCRPAVVTGPATKKMGGDVLIHQSPWRHSDEEVQRRADEACKVHNRKAKFVRRHDVTLTDAFGAFAPKQYFVLFRCL